MHYDIAWVAGLLDGEGCVSINRQHCSRRVDLKTDSFRLYVQITLGHLETLNRVQRIMGCGTVQPHTVSNRRANKAWCWMTSANDAKCVLTQLLPHLFTKAEEARIGLEFGRIAPWQPGGRGGAPKKSPEAADWSSSGYHPVLDWSPLPWRS